MNAYNWLKEHGLDNLEREDFRSAEKIAPLLNPIANNALMNPRAAQIATVNLLNAIAEENLILIRQNNRIERLLLLLAKNAQPRQG